MWLLDIFINLAEWQLCLVAHSFIKLSQNVFLINTHILIYSNARCNSKLLYFYCFFRVFSYIIDYHLCLNCCISTNLSQIVCLINLHILVCQHAKCNCRLYRRFSDSITLKFYFYGFFFYIITYLRRYNFIKLLQIVCHRTKKVLCYSFKINLIIN